MAVSAWRIPADPATRAVGILDVDPDLGDALEPDARRQAARLLRVPLLEVPRGAWEPPRMERAAYGLLVVRGLMARRVTLGRVATAEVVGEGDVLRPWEDGLVPSMVSATSQWEVLHDAEVAVIGARATALIAHWPPLHVALATRLLRRSQSLAYLMADSHYTRIEDRLLLTLWHLASLWGRVTSAGIVVPFALTHSVLGQIVGARRPSVTTALGMLQRQGRVSRTEDGRYVVMGDPPEWLTGGGEG